MTIPLQLGYEVIRSYKRLSYTPWHAFAEFVDNSTQSYFTNKTVLDAAYIQEQQGLEVRFVYDRAAGLIRVSDNAMGMNLAELEAAMTIGHPPVDTTGRSQYGLGLKTAAFWLGNRWTVRTKRLGEPEEHTIEVDLEAVTSGTHDLPLTSIPKDPSLHYTVIEIRDLNVRLVGRTLGKIKKFLRSMYRVDMRNRALQLYWEDAPLEWSDDFVFMTAVDGSPYRRDFHFDVNGKAVSGWLGILGPGSSGRPNAGFSIIRRGRVIKGWPESWRPEDIFGQIQGSNDLVNQRIVGEITLDDFEVSHTKDDILWESDEEDGVQRKLKEEAVDYIALARAPRKGGDTRGPSEAEVQAAVDELRSELESKEFVDFIAIETVPPPDIVTASRRPMIEAAERQVPRFVVSVGDEYVCRLFLTGSASLNDPYFASDVVDASRSIDVIVNMMHPHWAQLGDSESVLTYLRQCVYDAIAEWQCRRKVGVIQPDSIKAIKDGLLRLPSRIEEAAALYTSDHEDVDDED